MKAIRIHEEGGPEVLRYEDAPDPEPADGEVLVELRAASLNHLDIWVRKGLPSVPKPRILVAEHMNGTHAELIAVPRDYVHPIPDGLSFEEGAAFLLLFETAYRMLVTK